MAEGPIKFLIFYMAFFLVVALLGTQIPATGVGVEGADLSALPALDDSNLTLLSYLLFAFEWAVFFLGLQGLAVVGIPAAYAAILGIIFDTILVYVVVRLVRGGG